MQGQAPKVETQIERLRLKIVQMEAILILPIIKMVKILLLGLLLGIIMSLEVFPQIK